LKKVPTPPKTFKEGIERSPLQLLLTLYGKASALFQRIAPARSGDPFPNFSTLLDLLQMFAFFACRSWWQGVGKDKGKLNFSTPSPLDAHTVPAARARYLVYAHSLPCRKE
jgi:hypothetical protein